MIGIYIITNKITGNSYIGQSVDIETRFKTHKSRALSTNQKVEEHDKALYRAIRKYGIDNFEFNILETLLTTDRDYLNERERYWIAFYDTYHNGYNETIGSDGVVGMFGEKHHNHKLTEKDVVDIRIRWHACVENVHEIYEDYKNRVTRSGFKKIYTWQTWKNVLPELYDKKVVAWHNEQAPKLWGSPGEKNPNSKLSDAEVWSIWERKYKGESTASIYIDFQKNNLTLGSFTNVANGHYRKQLRKKFLESIK